MPKKRRKGIEGRVTIKPELVGGYSRNTEAHKKSVKRLTRIVGGRSLL